MFFSRGGCSGEKDCTDTVTRPSFIYGQGNYSTAFQNLHQRWRCARLTSLPVLSQYNDSWEKNGLTPWSLEKEILLFLVSVGSWKLWALIGAYARDLDCSIRRTHARAY